MRKFTKTAILSSFAISLSTLSGPLMTHAHAAASPSLLDSKPKTPRSKYTTDVLIYGGDDAAYGDPEAFEFIAKSQGMTSKTVTSDQLNQMSVDDLSKFGVIAWPGGYAGVMSQSLTDATRENIKKAVQEQGVGFVGICAGAFIAQTPDTKSGVEAVTGKELPYYHLEDEGTDDAMVGVKFSDGKERQLVWWGGPYLPEWKDGVIARYTDTNQPAIAETWSGNALVILSGPHPEAPQDWRDKLGLTDSDGLDQDIAGQMLKAAETQQPMPAS